MPNLAAHIDLAQESARRIHDPVVLENMGHFLLGSTSPDIRAITRRSREEYHFATLDFDRVGAGVRGLLEAHPGLRNGAEHSGRTRAFVAGYITHLVADEVWIMDMYRPHFGNRSVFADEASANVMDRAMQMEMDRRSWPALDAATTMMAGAAEGVEVEFLDQPTLEKWLDWVFTVADRGFSWDRLRFMANRVARGESSHPAHAVAESFLAGMPGSLETLYERVPVDNIDLYRRRTVDALVDEVERFLA